MDDLKNPDNEDVIADNGNTILDKTEKDVTSLKVVASTAFRPNKSQYYKHFLVYIKPNPQSMRPGLPKHPDSIACPLIPYSHPTSPDLHPFSALLRYALK
jgi:hypothetical protein